MRSWLTAANSRRLVWRLLQLLTVVVVARCLWELFTHLPYHIDLDVYRMSAKAWLDGRPLYHDSASFHTASGADLPFTYPPLSAIVFTPFTWLSYHAASVVMTAITLVLLVVSTMIVLAALEVWPTSAVSTGPAWARRCWLAVAIAVVAIYYFEPIRTNLVLGQINVVLMTLVLADCVPHRTPWPRGVLLGVAIALKLTPAVFLLYFAFRRDKHAALTAAMSCVGATLLGFALAWRDSLEYWTSTLRDTNRIGTSGYFKNQNIVGALARLDLTNTERFTIWIVGGFAVLAMTVWASRRALRAGEPVLALCCIALFGLVVSPVSWSHHWVWVVPTLLTTGALAYQRRNLSLAAVTAVGLVMMVWTPFELLPEHRESTASLWRQLVGASYIWWALAVILVAGATVATRAAPRPHGGAELTRPTRRQQAVPAAPSPP
jgi:alpha-1,2-mannosyltransferase